LLLAAALAALVHAAVGIGRARGWYVLPVACAWIGLAGFLINPVADSYTTADLWKKLTHPELLSGLCILQFAQIALAVWFALRLKSPMGGMHGGLGLAAIQALPAPAVVVGMLLVEQRWLAAAPGTRPETVGLIVGMTAAAILVVVCGIGLALPRAWMALPHHLFSAGLLAACIFMPVLEIPLVEPMEALDYDSLDLLAKSALAAAPLVWWGWLRPSVNARAAQASRQSSP
jgi:hypothetical protein